MEADKTYPEPELAELAQLRLDRNLSFAALAAEISECTGLRISERTVYRLIEQPPRKLYNTTLYRIRRYLRIQREEAAAAAGAAR